MELHDGDINLTTCDVCGEVRDCQFCGEEEIDLCGDCWDARDQAEENEDPPAVDDYNSFMKMCYGHLKGV